MFGCINMYPTTYDSCTASKVLDPSHPFAELAPFKKGVDKLLKAYHGMEPSVDRERRRHLT
jgi:hypothetical protein